MKPEDKCYSITFSFEGGGFGTLSGNFDGMGISYGAIQFNFGTGTLQNLLREFYRNGQKTFAKCCTVNGVDHSPELLAVIKESVPNSKAVEWSKTIQKKNWRGVWVINSVWKQIFSNLTQISVYVNVQKMFIERSYMARAKSDVEKIGVKTERALSLMFDIAVQNGGLKPYHMLLVDKTKKGNDLLADIAKAVAKKSNSRWYNDVLSRKMCIVLGKGKVHGKIYDLFNFVGLSDAHI